MEMPITLPDQAKTVLLRELRFGHEANPPLNARKRNREEDDPSFDASIGAKGVLVPMIVCQEGGLYFVADGNRRLRVLQQMLGRGAIRDTHLVTVIQKPRSEGFEISLMANLERQNMHPVDEYEAFATLATTLTPGQIAARFGLSTRQVQQRLALGELAPEIRELWASGQLSLEQAKCFTLARDHQHQVDTLEKLKADGVDLAEWRIRSALVGETTSHSQAARFVGKEAYIFAGGRLRGDLFDDAEIVLDPDILERLATDKLQQQVDYFRGKGWSWVKLANDMPRSSYMWDRLSPSDSALTAEEQHAIDVLEEQLRGVPQFSPEAREIEGRIQQLRDDIRLESFSADERARSGVVLKVSPTGELKVHAGVLWQGTRTAPKAPAADEAPTVPATEFKRLPIEVEGRLALEQTRAIANVVARWPDVALRVAVGAAAREGVVPVFLRATGALEGPGLELLAGFTGDGIDVLTKVAVADDATLNSIFAAIVGMAVDTTRLVKKRDDSDLTPGREVDLLLAFLPELDYLAEIQKQFDAEAYFRGAPREFAEAALREMNVDVPAPSARKSEAATKAATHARMLGWLPVSLRHIATRSAGGPAMSAEEQGAVPLRRGPVDSAFRDLLRRIAVAIAEAVGDQQVTIEDMASIQALLLGDSIVMADPEDRASLREAAIANLDLVLSKAQS